MDKTYAKQLAAVALLGLAAISSQAQAAELTVCAATATKTSVNGGSGATSASTTGFFQQGFSIQCSNNVFASVDEVSANLLRVAAGSQKGNQSYNGNSNGGAITTSAKCTGTNDACTAANVTTALGAAGGS